MTYLMSMPGGVLRTIVAPQECGEGPAWSELYGDITDHADQEATQGAKVGLLCLENVGFHQVIASIAADVDEAVNMPETIRAVFKDTVRKNMITVIRQCVRK